MSYNGFLEIFIKISHFLLWFHSRAFNYFYSLRVFLNTNGKGNIRRKFKYYIDKQMKSLLRKNILLFSVYPLHKMQYVGNYAKLDKSKNNWKILYVMDIKTIVPYSRIDIVIAQNCVLRQLESFKSNVMCFNNSNILKTLNMKVKLE